MASETRPFGDRRSLAGWPGIFTFLCHEMVDSIRISGYH